MARTAAGVADTSTAGWAAELVRDDTVQMVRDVAPISAWAQLATAGTPLRFNGAKSAVVPAVPLVNQAAEPAWVGEGGVIPTTRGTVSGSPVTAYKLAGIVPITKELENSSDAVAVMRQLPMAGAVQALEDVTWVTAPA